MTWLIAEDEVDIRTLVAIMVEAWGHQVLAFENGQRVWDWLDKVEQGQETTLPELIIMDIRMPGKKGTEVAERMRKMDALKDIPIVLMTAYTLDDSERHDMLSIGGANHVLNKPLPDFEQMRVILHDLVDQKQTTYDQPTQ